MKKLITLIMSTVLVLSTMLVVGCQSTPTPKMEEKTIAKSEQTTTEKPTTVYIGDKLKDENIPDEDIGETALIPIEKKDDDVIKNNKNQINIKKKNNTYFYLEVEKEKELYLDIYIDKTFIGKGTIGEGAHKLYLSDAFKTLGEHTIYFLGYDSGTEEKTKENVTYFRKYTYNIVE